MACILPSITSCILMCLPAKHALVWVLIVLVEAKSHLSVQHIVPGLQQQELEQSHFPCFVQGPHLQEMHSKMGRHVFGKQLQLCIDFLAIKQGLCERTARV